jgi:hypothetical protein
MSHLKLFGLIAGVLTCAYLMLCLAGSSRWEVRAVSQAIGPCDSPVQPWAEALLTKGDTQSLSVGSRQSVHGAWPFSALAWGPIRPFSKDTSRVQMNGTWGQHQLEFVALHEENVCRFELHWRSLHVPFYMRGAGILLGFRQEVHAQLGRWVEKKSGPLVQP